MNMGGQEHNYRRVMSADTLRGDRVVNRQGEDLGKIEEFMLDTVDGRSRTWCCPSAEYSAGQQAVRPSVPLALAGRGEPSVHLATSPRSGWRTRRPSTRTTGPTWPGRVRDKIDGDDGVSYGDGGYDTGTQSMEGLTEEERSRRRAA